MQEKSSAFYAGALVIPIAFGLFVWGYGGEDTRYAGGAAALLAVGLAVDRIAQRRVCATRPAWLTVLYVLCGLALIAVVRAADVYSALHSTVFLFLLASTIDLTMRASPLQRRGLLYGMLIVSTLTSAYGIAQILGLADNSIWHNGLFASRFVNNAHYAALAAATTPLALGLMLSEDRAALRLVALLAAAVSNAGLILARSRAIWLIALIVYGTLLLVLMLGGSDMARARRRSLWIGAFILLAVGIASVWFYRDPLTTRLMDVSATRGQSISHRMDVWRVAWRMIRANPTGVGLGCFGEEFLRYKTTPDRYVALRAHNELIQLTAELGWAGLLLFGICGILFIRDMIRGWLPLEKLPVLVLCAAAGIDVFLFHSMVDFPLRLRANALFLAVLLGCMPIVRKAARPPARRVVMRLRLAARLALLLAGGLFSGAASLSARFAFHANEHLRYARLDQAAPLLEKAAKAMSLDPEVLYELGGVDYAWALWAEPVEKRARLTRACGYLARSARLAGSRGMTYLRWAWALADLGQHEQADRRFRDAIACDPTLGRYHVYYADFLLEQNRRALAVEHYHQALTSFHDDSAVNLQAILAKLHDAGGSIAELRAVTPDDALSQRRLATFLEGRELP